MFTPVRFLCVAFLLSLILLGSSREVHAQWYGGHGRFGGYGGWGFFDSGIGAFGGGRYPGYAFGYHPSYLASRAFTAGGVAGSVTYGTPQPEVCESPVPAALARAATRTTGPCEDKVLSGEAAFWRGDYLGAVEDWNNSLNGGPPNPVLIMMLGQAYFAAGNYREATVTTQAAMRALPQDQWGVVVANRHELYGNPKAYVQQLQQLETSVNENPKDPAERFLLGYHYAYLGYPQPAVAQLDKVVELEPRDELAAELRKVLTPRLPDPGAPVITPGVVTSPRSR
jgi:hypothetical protein